MRAFFDRAAYSLRGLAVGLGLVCAAFLSCENGADSWAICNQEREAVLPIFGGLAEPTYLQASEQTANAIALVRFDLGDKHGECTAFFIDARWVLTAAHCAPSGAVGAVLVGSGIESSSISKPVVSIIRHPTLDVLLLELSEPESNIIPIKMFDSDPVGFQGANVQIAGFGLTHEGERGKRRFAVTTLEEVGAESLFTSSVSGSGACEGDSGGPLLTRDFTGRVVALGVLSRGSVACNQVDEYTRIDLIRDWVLQFAEVLLIPDTGACENISARGRCFANTAVWCGANDELIATPCGVEQCGWSGFVNGFRCVKDDPCHGIDDFGLCRDETTLLSCDDGHVAQSHCVCAQHCVVSSSDGSAYCGSDQLER